jgi:outer membrane protein assembly factor BamA
MRLFRVLPALAAVCLCALAPSAYSQTRLIPAITFTGAPGYSQAELLAFTGLKPGNITQEQLDDATQRLSDTGLFEDVNFSGNDKGVVYALKPGRGVLPVRFANFVWWQDDEINQTLKAQVALYRAAAVPTAGNLRDSICAALKAMVTAKGLQGANVSSVLSSPRAGAPIDSLAFQIDSPRVLIHSLTLRDASLAMQPKLARVIKDMAGQPWDKGTTNDNVASRVGDVYRNEGYLDIAVADQSHSDPFIADGSVNLDLTATMNEGSVYHVSQLAWAGSNAISAGDFAKKATLHKGDVASPVALGESLRVLKDAYGALGYIDAKADPAPEIDHTAHMVAYTISVAPGDQYRLGSVRFVGFSDAQQKELEGAWRMKPGDAYDSTYYFTRFYAQSATMHALANKVRLLEKRDPSALTVDVTVSLGGPAAH